MIAYSAVALVSTLAGLGLLSVLGAPGDRLQRWLLAPAACLVLWVILLAAGLSVGVTTARLAWPVWGVTGLAATFGVWRLRDTWTRQGAAVWLAAAVTPVLVLSADFERGLRDYIGGPAPDGWSYVAFSQYLWAWPRGTEGGLAPLYQYASHLSHVRLAGSGILGFLSTLTGQPGDTQAAAGCFVAWTLLVFGASCAACGSAIGLRRGWLVVLCLLSATSRWVFGAIQIHNYDNLVAISFLPVTMTLMTVAERPSWRVAAGLGVVLAAAGYAYPEMAAFVVLGVVIAIATRLWLDRQVTAWMAFAVGTGIITLVLLGPAMTDLSRFLSNQVTAATVAVGARAGEGNFPALVSGPSWWITFWGFEPLSPTGRFARLASAWTITQTLIDTMLWLLTAWGVARLVARRRLDLVVLGVLLTLGELFMVVRQHYSYGAYKFLLLEAWITATFMVVGAEGVKNWIIGRVETPRRIRRVMAVAAAAVVVGGVGGTFLLRDMQFHLTLDASTIAPYRGLSNIDRVIGPAPVLVAVDDAIANEWAVYFLRNHPSRVLGYRGYMAMSHVVPLMDRAAAIDLAAVRYVLGDDPPQASRDVVWAEGPYTLWRIPARGAALLGEVSNAYGAERFQGQSFYWIGTDAAHMEVIATANGTAVLTGTFFRGPSLPTSPVRHLRLTSGNGAQDLTIDRDGEVRVTFPVRLGGNRIALSDLDQPTAIVPHDPRRLLVGIEGLHVAMAESR